MSDIHTLLNLRHVINASGKMTILGGAKVSEDVLEAQKFGSQNFFIMEELMKNSGGYLADLLEVEAAQIVSSASAGIAQSVAALIGKGSMKHVYKPYDFNLISGREVVIPKGHNVDYGVPVELMIAQGGGQMIEAGYANICSAQHVEREITDKTVALLYIKSHHAVQKSILTVEELCAVGKKYHIPVIVDAAAEEDLTHYYRVCGADLVIYSGKKALEGPSSGLVIGKKNYVEWIRLQSKGLGRSMKIGKENILGLLAAVERYVQQGSESGESIKNRLEPFIKQLNDIPYLEASIVQDGAGRDIFRARVIVSAPYDAKDMIKKQKEANPAVFTREYLANQGIIEYDIRAINKSEMDEIIKLLKKLTE